MVIGVCTLTMSEDSRQNQFTVAFHMHVILQLVFLCYAMTEQLDLYNELSLLMHSTCTQLH